MGTCTYYPSLLLVDRGVGRVEEKVGRKVDQRKVGLGLRDIRISDTRSKTPPCNLVTGSSV